MVTRGFAYETRYYDENGKEINEHQFTQGIDKKSELKLVQIEDKKESSEDSSENNDQTDSDYQPSEENDRKKIKVGNKSTSSLDFDSETSEKENGSEYILSEQR